MKKETTVLLAFITQATWQQFEDAKVFNAVHHLDAEQDLAISELVPHPLFESISVDALASCTVKHNPERQAKLEQLIYHVKPEHYRWIQDAKATEWHEANWSSNATQLFMTAVSQGVSGTAAYAIVAAHMTLQGFPVPKTLAGCLRVAQEASRQNRQELANAEKRREEELRQKGGSHEA